MDVTSYPTVQPEPVDMGPALELRELLARGRAGIRDFHARGGSGEQITAAITALCDRVVLRAYDRVDEQIFSKTWANPFRQSSIEGKWRAASFKESAG